MAGSAGLESLAGLLNLVLQKAEGLIDFGEILDSRFHLQNQNEANLLALLR